MKTNTAYEIGDGLLTIQEIGLMRLESFLLALKLEINNRNVTHCQQYKERFCSSCQRTYTKNCCHNLIKNLFGFTGNKQEVYDQMQNYINERKIKQDHDIRGYIKWITIKE